MNGNELLDAVSKAIVADYNVGLNPVMLWLKDESGEESTAVQLDFLSFKHVGHAGPHVMGHSFHVAER